MHKNTVLYFIGGEKKLTGKTRKLFRGIETKIGEEKGESAELRTLNGEISKAIGKDQVK